MQWGRGGWCLSQDTPPASPQSLALSRGVLHSWCPWVSPPPKAWSQRVSIRVQSDQAASGTSHPLSNSECEILCALALEPWERCHKQGGFLLGQREWPGAQPEAHSLLGPSSQCMQPAGRLGNRYPGGQTKLWCVAGKLFCLIH